jgi:hypothetical protein
MIRIRRLAGAAGAAEHRAPTGQLERELRAKAAAHARRELTTEAYLAEHGRIAGEIDALAEAQPVAPIDDVDEIVRRLRTSAGRGSRRPRGAGRAGAGDLPPHHGRRRQVRSVALTEEAERLALPMLLPTVVMARPAGARLTQTTVPVRQSIRIEGRGEWLRIARSA